MISSETPDKLREIIQDTWPQLFRPGVNSNRSLGHTTHTEGSSVQGTTSTKKVK